MIRSFQDRPTRVRFPFGYTVLVTAESAKEMLADGDDEDEGWWDSGARTLHMCRDLDDDRYAEVFAHELNHAVLDYELWIRDCYVPAPIGAEIEWRCR